MSVLFQWVANPLIRWLNIDGPTERFQDPGVVPPTPVPPVDQPQERVGPVPAAVLKKCICGHTVSRHRDDGWCRLCSCSYVEPAESGMTGRNSPLRNEAP